MKYRNVWKKIMKSVLRVLISCWVALGFCSVEILAHDDHARKDSKQLIKEWTFWPDYTLEGTAKNYSGNRPDHPANPRYFLQQLPQAHTLMGNEPTEHFWELLKGEQLPAGPFTVEAWMLYHVNTPIGLSINQTSGDDIDWSVGYFDRSMYVVKGAEKDAGVFHTFPKEYRGYFNDGFKEKWHHIAASYDGQKFSLFYNGALIGTKTIKGDWKAGDASRLEVVAYMKNEDYMQTGNSLNTLAVYNKALSENTIKELFHKRSLLVEEGRLFEDMFHYTAGPYLNAAGENNVKLLWETDRPSNAVVKWGETAEFDNNKAIAGTDRLHRAELTGLKANTAYFYEIIATDSDGTEMSSGVLTFRTSPKADEPLSFAVIGDTEARPHINDVIAKQVWNERPQTVLLVGDLTDGGFKNHRWQWTHEYFLGVNQLAGRVPFLPAPGNGEDDLVWYNHYHNLTNDGKSYYSHRMGDVEFFMLDSNMGHHNKNRPGFRQQQKEWLEKALKASTAKWKVAGHHHPIYSSDEDDYGDSFKEKSLNGDMATRDDFLDLYEKYGVDVVFFGHLHSYERTWPILKGRADKSGVVYIQTGGGGGNHEMAAPTRNWFTNQLYSGYHYAFVKQFENTMSITVRDSEGRVRDKFDIEK